MFPRSGLRGETRELKIKGLPGTGKLEGRRRKRRAAWRFTLTPQLGRESSGSEIDEKMRKERKQER